MKNIGKSALSCVVLALLCSIALHAQSDSKNDKEVIIIEKVKDENGNIISKKIIRSSNGDLTDEQIEKELENSNNNLPFGNGGFDLGGFDLFGNRSTNSNPTLGVSLSFETDQALITSVVPGSGAEEAELRKGDIIISVDGFVVNTIDDIKNYINDKKEGDKVLLSIIRDGQSFEKEVTLKVNNFGMNDLFGNLSPETFKNFGQMFDFGGGSMPFELDSLLKNFDGFDGFKGGNMPFEFGMPNYSERDVEEERPSLGIFIDEAEDGVIIAEVIEDSPAEKAKLRVNDKIIKIDGNKIESFDDLAKLVRAAGKNTKLLITYIRNGKEKEAEVILE